MKISILCQGQGCIIPRTCFREAFLRYDLPSKVQSDRGGENVRIANYMLSHPERGTGRGSFITGHSVHNARIEQGGMCSAPVKKLSTSPILISKSPPNLDKRGIPS